MTKRAVINGHRMQQKGRQPHKRNKRVEFHFDEHTKGEPKSIREVIAGLPKLEHLDSDRDRLLTEQLAAVCNALADALGMPADQIDPNRLPEYVRELAQGKEKERDAERAWEAT